MAGGKMLMLAFGAVLVAYATGHGMMMEPPNRSSMWRFYPDSPPNFDDNENFCGGYGIQWGTNDGKCGLCGDNYRDPRPRKNENTGTYGEGKIAGEYRAGGQIDVAILLTANHWGYFNFSVCPLLDSTKPEPDNECFQQIPLVDGSLSYKLKSSEKGYFNTTLQLPPGLKCEHCTLRWHYYTGNTWGQCEDGSHQTGCGPQETFMSCADIAIH